MMESLGSLFSTIWTEFIYMGRHKVQPLYMPLKCRNRFVSLDLMKNSNGLLWFSSDKVTKNNQ